MRQRESKGARDLPPLDEVTRQAAELCDRFDIEAVLGAGGMGVVLRAHERALSRRVAIKLLRDPGTLRTTAAARLLREARLAS
ncbi:MAG: hypothetical protein JOZ69_01785, partial [Myxococcales bacterium]|nr:hypothetical protein [Myxococcales bacterium]